MNTNSTILRHLLLFILAVKVIEAFTIPPYPTGVRSGVGRSNFDQTGLGLFRPYQNQRGYDGDVQRHRIQKLSRIGTIISQKLKVIRSFMSFRFSSVFRNNKSRYLSILAAAVIAAGTFPSRVTAEVSRDHASIATTSIRTLIHSDTEKVRNKFFKDAAEDSFFGANLQYSNGFNAVFEKNDGLSIDENDGTYPFETNIGDHSTGLPIAEDIVRIPTTGQNRQPEDGLLVLNDKMVKIGVRNVALASTGAAAILYLGKKTARIGSEDVYDAKDKNENVIPSRSETTSDRVADLQANEGLSLPLLDKKYVEARHQPKSPKDEAILASRYAAIPTVEERAYQILVDLGMIEVRS